MDSHCDKILAFLEEHKQQGAENGYKAAIEALAKLKMKPPLLTYTVVIVSPFAEKKDEKLVISFKRTEYEMCFEEERCGGMRSAIYEQGGFGYSECIQYCGSNWHKLGQLLKTHDALSAAVSLNNGCPAIVAVSRVVAITPSVYDDF